MKRHNSEFIGLSATPCGYAFILQHVKGFSAHTPRNKGNEPHSIHLSRKTLSFLNRMKDTFYYIFDQAF